MPRWPWRRERRADPLGDGLWRRLYDDCAGAARTAPVLVELLPRVYALAESAQVQWPSNGLDVPASADGQARHRRLREVRRAFVDVAYRQRLAGVPGAVPAQERHLAEALDRARRALED